MSCDKDKLSMLILNHFKITKTKAIANITMVEIR